MAIVWADATVARDTADAPAAWLLFAPERCITDRQAGRQKYLRIAVCSSTLLLPLRDVRGCRLSGRCLTCRAQVEAEVARLILDATDVTVGQVAARLACDLCGTPPVGVALIEDSAPDAVWLGDDASREGWMPDWVGQWCGPLHPGGLPQAGVHIDARGRIGLRGIPGAEAPRAPRPPDPPVLPARRRPDE